MTTRAFASSNAHPPSASPKKQSAADHHRRNEEDAIGHVLHQDAGRSNLKPVNGETVSWPSERGKDGWDNDPHTIRFASGALNPASPCRGDADAATASKKNPPSADDGLVERSNRNRLLQESLSQGLRQAQLLQQQQQQQQQPQKQAPPSHPPPLSIRWERFLPQQQLRVLLVEDDDSTRHVVSALLRNCSYEVTSAASGLVAWGLLTEQTSCQFDIILTEVVMPGLSGIGLLSRIMAQESIKHIPVVMMSSHDSMGIVFKCLSKGAVDFLVKPVRKNELKNLWQHVWRRCQSSSGSGSDCGSGSQTREAGRHGMMANGGDNSNGNTDSDNTSSGLNLRGGSDNGSGTQLQGSWTKRAIEVESSQHTKFEPAATPGTLQYTCKQQAEKGCASQPERMVIDHGSVSHDPADKAAMAGRQVKKEANFCCDGEDVEDAMAEKRECDKRNAMEEEGDDNDAGSDSTKGVNVASTKGVNVAGGGKGNGEEQQGESADVDEEEGEEVMMMMMMEEKHASNSPSSNKDKFVSDSSSPSQHQEPALKNPRLAVVLHDDSDRERQGLASGLRHSCSSAFSRYNSSLKAGHGAQLLAQGSGVGSNSHSSVPVSAQMHRLVSTDGSEFTTPLRHGSHASNDCTEKQQEDGVSTTFAAAKDESPPPPSFKAGTLSSTGAGALQKSLMGHATFWAGDVAVEKRAEAADDCCISFEQVRTNQRSQIHLHTHHHSHHHHHHVQHHFHYHHKYPHQERPSTPQQESHTVTNLAPESCPSSLLPNEPGSSSNNNHNNNDNNASATGSNNGSNGHSNAQSAADIVLSAGNEDRANHGDDGAGNSMMQSQAFPDNNRSARREAALTKFRQKRKERCFEKKVRYQSRKRLAEQRPRVRGQFVRQSMYEFSARDGEQG